ncbi:Uncharacterized protein QTN25_003024 [Entamoeba marina]
MITSLFTLLFCLLFDLSNALWCQENDIIQCGLSNCILQPYGWKSEQDTLYFVSNPFGSSSRIVIQCHYEVNITILTHLDHSLFHFLLSNSYVNFVNVPSNVLSSTHSNLEYHFQKSSQNVHNIYFNNLKGEIVNCIEYANEICTNCSDPYIPSQDGSTCEKCPEGQYKYDTLTCDDCNNSISNCQICSDDGSICTNCSDPYIPSSDGSTCEKCPNGQYKYDTLTCDYCYNSIDNCQICSDDGSTCTNCSDPYIPLSDGSTCEKCPNGQYKYDTLTCDYCYNSIDNCQICSDDGSTCTNCSDPYIPSSDGSICEKCPNGQYKYDTSTCDYCYNSIDNCQICSNDGSICTNCSDPYIPSSNGSICEKCPNGQYKYDTLTCDDCYNSIDNCQICSDDGSICTNCSDPYIPSQDGSICEKCPNGQYKYDTSTCDYKSTCTNCSDPYIPSSDGSICEKCPNGQYKYDTLTCDYCYNSIDNCQICSDDGSTCTNCSDPYIPSSDGSTCEKCPNGQYKYDTLTCDCLLLFVTIC